MKNRAYINGENCRNDKRSTTLQTQMRGRRWINVSWQPFILFDSVNKKAKILKIRKGWKI